MSPGFTAKDWRNATAHDGGGDTSTPLSAVAIEDLETRVTDFSDLLAGRPAGIFNLKDYGAAGDNLTDDTAAITAAIAAADAVGGTVYAPPGIYLFAGEIEVTGVVSIRGAGSDFSIAGTEGTIFRATDAAAQLLFTGSTSLHSNFTIDGDGVANYPMKVGLCFAATFINVSVVSALLDNVTLYDSQQATFYSCNSSKPARDCLVLDGSVNSCLFSRWESDSPGRHGLYLGPNAGTFGYYVSFTRFDHSLFEQQADVSDDEMVLIHAGHPTFDTCQFVTSDGTDIPVVSVDETVASTGTATFRDCIWQNNVAPARTGLFVDCVGLGAVRLQGSAYFGGYLDQGVFTAVDDTLWIHDSIQANFAGGVDNRAIDPTSNEVRLVGNPVFVYPSWERFNGSTGWGVDPTLVAPESIFFSTTTDKLTYRAGDGTYNALY